MTMDAGGQLGGQGPGSPVVVAASPPSDALEDQRRILERPGSARRSRRAGERHLHLLAPALQDDAIRLDPDQPALSPTRYARTRPVAGSSR